jgi:hypothetical protein
MTGRFSIRSGTHSIPIGEGLVGLTRWDVTIAEALSEVGYYGYGAHCGRPDHQCHLSLDACR